jgi:hypothetical protein
LFARWSIGICWGCNRSFPVKRGWMRMIGSASTKQPAPSLSRWRRMIGSSLPCSLVLLFP